MNNKMARITVLIFGIMLFIASGIGMHRYNTSTHTTATITAISDVRKMYGNNNPLYRNYYEEDVMVTYDDDKTGELTIKERFKRQLPIVGDTIPILISKSGKVEEETAEEAAESFTRPIVMILVVIFLIVLGIDDKKRSIHEENTDKTD